MIMSEAATTSYEEEETEDVAEEVTRREQLIELLSAALLALATIATAWSGYQSSLWGGDQASHESLAGTAIIKTGLFSNLAEQKVGLHTSLFGQWAAAVSAENTALADFLFDRFPEPLQSAAVAWRATQPLTNPDAPASPFDMPEYVLPESAESLRWEEVAIAESAAADGAGEIADRYLLFTIIFALVLFFGGISGKFSWQLLDVVVLVLGGLVMIAGLLILFTSPVKLPF
jgi:hypothetical protein